MLASKVRKKKGCYIGGAAMERKKKKREKKEYVGAPSTSIIIKLATYKDVCRAEATSVEDPSLANNRRWK